MRHQYKTESSLKKNVQAFIDFFVDLYSKIFVRKINTSWNTNPEKILFVTIAQLGDALVESYVFPLIKERYPKASLDVLTCSWCKPILEHNPYIRNLIFFDHFRMNRVEKSFFKKIARHISTSRSALKNIRIEKYDLSIEAGLTHPNGNLLCYRGKVKRRIGSGSGGFGSLLTDEVPFPAKNGFHILEALLDKLRRLGIDRKLEEIKPYYITSNIDNQELQQFASFINDPFVLIHPESGNSKRLMSDKFWLDIVGNILNLKKFRVVVCGTSERSRELVRYFLSNLKDSKEWIIDLVGKISLNEFFLLGKKAKATITLESLAAHLCSINCRTISFYKNGSGAFFFPIPNKNTTIIHNHSLSKELKTHPSLQNFYINDFDSKKTIEIVNDFLKNVFY